MTIIRTRTILWAASGSFIGLAIAVAGGSFLSPLDVPEPTRLPVAVDDSKESGSSGPTIPSLSSFEPLWSLPTDRPPASAPKPNPVASSTTVAPVLPIRLVGTIIETGKSMGMFANATGIVEIRAVGEKIGEEPMSAKLLSVSVDSAELQYQGKKVVLKLPKREDG